MSVDNKLMLAATEAAYKGGAVEKLGEYRVDDSFPNAGTGFKATAYTDGKGNYIIAFAGTEDFQDIYQDVKLGWDQWRESRQEILEYLSRALERDPTATIHFTGHSLGGALAQYAVYDLLAMANADAALPDADELVSQLSLTTFNGLGGVAGLKTYLHEIGLTYDPGLVAGIENYHYFVQGDLISRFGGGHLGGNTLMLSDGLGSFDPLTGHVLDTVQDLADYGGGLEAAVAASPGYLECAGFRSSIAMIAWYFNGDGAAGDLESEARLGAVLAGLLWAPAVVGDLDGAGAGQLNYLLRTVFENLSVSATLHQLLPSAERADLKRLAEFNWERLLLSEETTSTVAGAAVLDFLSETLGVEPEAIVQALPDPVGSIVENFLAELELLTEFRATWAVGKDELVGALGEVFGAVFGFESPSYKVVAISDAQLEEGGTGQLTVTLEREAPDSGVRVAIRVADPTAVSLSGANITVIDAARGLYRLDFEPGQQVVTITATGLVDDDHIDEFVGVEAGSVPFSELGDVFVDTTYALAGIEVTESINEESEPRHYSRVIEGDLRWKDFDADEPGIQVHYDALGNIITDGTANPGQADDLNDSAGNDEIYAGGGDDTVEALRGGDDLIDGGDGRDYLYGGRGADLVRGGGGRDSAGGAWGDDTVVGGTGNDFLSGGGGNDRVFADDEVQVGAAIAAGRSEAGSAERGDFLNDNAGDDVVVGSSRSDVLAGGSGDDLLIAGGGNDFIDADESWVVTDRDWQFRYKVEQKPGSELYTHWIDGAYSRGVDAVGNDVIHAGGGEDYVVAGAGRDLLHGEYGADILWGGGGNDTLLGGQGDDLLEGDNGLLPNSTHGSDFIDGGAGDDRAYGGDRADTLFGGDGDDVLSGDGDDDYHGADYVSGEAGDDELYGGNADDFLDGGDGHDVLIAGRGEDTLFGGAGNDELTGDASDLSGELHGSDLLDGGKGADELFGGGAADSLFGGEQNDLLFGDSSQIDATYHGVDLLDGGAGDDQLVGAGESDNLFGGDGADRLYGDVSTIAGEHHGADLLDGGAGADQLVGGGAADSEFGGAGDDLLFGDDSGTSAEFHGNDLLDGGAGEDYLVGGGAADTAFGGTGNDTLFGDASDVAASHHGDDLLDGGQGADELVGGGAADALFGGRDDDRLFGDSSHVAAAYHGADSLDGGQGSDLLVGGGHADSLFGGSGNDTLNGDGTDVPASAQGNDYLSGGAGVDRLFGMGGADVLDGGAGSDALAGGEGADTLSGGDSNDWLNGGVGADVLDAGAGDDRVDGGAGDDTLAGGAGFDSLSGGGGNDRLLGGDGRDLYRFGLGDGLAFIRDAGSNILRFGSGIYLGNISLGLGSLKIGIEGSDDAVHIEGFDPDNPYRDIGIDRIEFAGGTVLSFEELLGLGFDLGGSAGNDVITGTVLEDRLHGLGGDDTLIAKAGDDLLDGGAGADRMEGNAGDDRYRVDQAGDAVIETAGEGRDHVESRVDYRLGDHLEDLTLTGAARRGIGNAAANVITGNAADNVIDGLDGNDGLHGGAGDDSLAGGAGSDEIHGGEGSDVLDGAGGDDVLDGGRGDSTLSGGAGDDRLVADDGSDSLAGGAGADVLYAAGGDDRLDGGGGGDSSHGGFGDDIYRVDSNADRAIEQADLIDRTPVVGSDGTTRYGTVARSGGHDRVLSSATFSLGHFVEELVLTGTESIDGFGSLATRRITGNAGDNALYAYRLNGRVGNLPGAPTSLSTTLDNGAEERLLDRTARAIYDGDITAATRIEADLTAGEGVTLTGGAGDDRLFGDWDNDTLRGGIGNDLLYGSAGADTLVGGQGDDTYVVDQGYQLSFRARDASLFYRDQGEDSLVETPGGGVDTIAANIDFVLPERFEHLVLLDDTGAYDQDSAVYGAPLPSDHHAVVGIGNAGDNRIVGNRYDNRLDGAAGADRLVGGDGDDTYVVDQAGDEVVETSASWWAGSDTVETALDYTLGENVENLTLTGTEDRTGTGNALDNRIRGNAGANALAGLAGADTIHGAAGDDVLNGGSGGDRLDGGVGDDRMVGGAGDDGYVVDARGDTVIEAAGAGYDRVDSRITRTLSGAVEHLRLTGSADIDGDGNALDNRIEGNSGRNRLRGHAGADRLDGEAGNDVMAGGTGDDRYVVGSRGDAVQEAAAAGHDTVETNLSYYTLTENVEDLELNGMSFSTGIGNALDNRIQGNDAANELYGRAGDDSIDAAAGNDELYGEAGDDTLYGGDDATRESFPDDGEEWYGDGEWGYGGYCEVLPNSDELAGGAGDDHLDGGSGDDVLSGGDGDDYLYGGDDGIARGACGGGCDDEYCGEELAYGDEIPYGGGASALGNDDELFGGAARDALRGGTGDDLLNGGTGIDDMAGGAGDDIYYVDGYAEVIEIPGGGDGDEGSDDDGSGEDDDCPPHRGKGNEGLGNGEDPPPPGHDDNWNDGPGTSPGNPGSQGGGGSHRGRGHDGDGDDDDDRSRGHGWDADGEDGCGSPATGGACDGFGDLPGGDSSNGGGDGSPEFRVVWHTDRVAEDADGGYDVLYSSASFVLPEHVEELHLTGSEAIDATGSADADELYGNDAANRLDGGAGADYLAGGGGDDTYVVRDTGDTIGEQAGAGVDTVESGIDRTLTDAGVENLTLIGAATSGTGNVGDNALTGNAGDDTLTGLAGNDVLSGGGGADTLRGGDGADVYVYTAGTGVDRIEDAAGANVLRFAGPLSPENVVARTTTAEGVTTVHVRLVDIHGNELHDQGVDFVLGADGASPIASFQFADARVASLPDLLATELHHQGSRRPDRLTTGREDDVIDAGGKHDRVWAGGGRDVVHGGSGMDRLFGQGGDDRLAGEAGRDALAGGMGFDVLFGGGAADRLRGGCQNDVVLGGVGDDRLSGDAGNDLIAGGEGDDRIDLVAGADVVGFNAGDGRDRVDFGDTERFTISLGGELRLADLALYRAGDDLLLRVGEGGNGCGEIDGITFEDWYDRAPDELPEVTLQMVMEASEDFEPASADVRRNRRITRYDLNALVEDFDSVGRRGWSATESLLDAHLASSAETALGGEPAYHYGLTGSVSGLSTRALVGTLASPEFGESPQRIGVAAVG